MRVPGWTLTFALLLAACGWWLAAAEKRGRLSSEARCDSLMAARAYEDTSAFMTAVYRDTLRPGETRTYVLPRTWKRGDVSFTSAYTTGSAAASDLYAKVAKLEWRVGKLEARP